MSKALIVKIILGVTALTAAVLLATWLLGGFVGLSANGAGALIVGTLASMLLGVGLMTVVFISSRSGHDQATYDATKSGADDPASPPRGTRGERGPG